MAKIKKPESIVESFQSLDQGGHRETETRRRLGPNSRQGRRGWQWPPRGAPAEQVGGPTKQRQEPKRAARKAEGGLQCPRVGAREGDH
jgi:hypothetical protein